MDKLSALKAFDALSQDTRLEIFRLLVKTGPEGLCVGEIVTHFAAKQNTISANLAVLAQAGLIASRRDGRSVRYFAHMEGISGLIDYLVADCCQGRPELCAPLAQMCGS